MWRVGYHSALCCLMLFACQFLNKARAQLTWQRMYLVNVGTWVRFPGPLAYFIFFPLIYSYAACPSVIHHMLSSMACQVAMSVHPMAKNQSPWSTPVNACAWDLKSQRGSNIQWAKMLPMHLHNWPENPLWFAFFFFFF